MHHVPGGELGAAPAVVTPFSLVHAEVPPNGGTAKPASEGAAHVDSSKPSCGVEPESNAPHAVLPLEELPRKESSGYLRGHDVWGRTHAGVQPRHLRAVKWLGAPIGRNVPRIGLLRFEE